MGQGLLVNLDVLIYLVIHIDGRLCECRREKVLSTHFQESPWRPCKLLTHYSRIHLPAASWTTMSSCSWAEQWDNFLLVQLLLILTCWTVLLPSNSTLAELAEPVPATALDGQPLCTVNHKTTPLCLTGHVTILNWSTFISRMHLISLVILGYTWLGLRDIIITLIGLHKLFAME